MNDMIRKASVFEILNHWVLAGSFFILAVSGFGFLFHLNVMNSIFGNFSQMRDIHNYAGAVFAVFLFLSIFSYIGEAFDFTGDDFKWFLKGGGYFSKGSSMPPQGRLNAGQKGYYLFLLIAGIAISASGLIIWLRPVVNDINRWVLLSHFIHNFSFDLVIVVVVFHIYLASFANPGSFRIMVYGTVPVEWARKRHARWIEKEGL